MKAIQIVIESLRAVVERAGSERKAAAILGVQGATVWKILHGRTVSPPTLEKIREAIAAFTPPSAQEPSSDQRPQREWPFTDVPPLQGSVRDNQVVLQWLSAVAERTGSERRAAAILGVQGATVWKILHGRTVSPPTLEKIRRAIAAFTPPSVGESFSNPGLSDESPKILVERRVSQAGGLREAAEELGVNPSTLKKLLDGRDLTSATMAKLLAALAKPPGVAGAGAEATRLRRLYDLYRAKGTLAAVAKVEGISRERVRQLLKQGTERGLFSHVARGRETIPPETLLEDYRRLGTFPAVARANEISPSKVAILLRSHGVTEQDLLTLRRQRQKEQCLEQYFQIAEVLGHHPTTTELQRKRNWKYLSIRLARLWGSTAAFRQELGIAAVKPGNPHFQEDISGWREHQRRLALITRMERLDRISERLLSGPPLSLAELAENLRLSRQTVYSLLRILISAGRVVREGPGSRSVYRAISGG